MSRTIQIRRGTAAEHENFIGKVGEVTMDTTNKTLRVHDGETAGGIMLAKKNEINDYFEIEENKNEIVLWGRQFTNVGTTIATGNTSIEGEYSLGFTDNNVKIGVFQCDVRNASSSGSAAISIRTDVMTTETIAVATNAYINIGTVTLPFINKIYISFPIRTGGIDKDTNIKFIGWM
ncbi:MAG: hypothetical protein II238_01820 [Alphaproteobacteria bacterium]|nr:hypothetical protein [Alphaproteobacteria bacterium]